MAEFCDFLGYNSDFVRRPLLKKGTLPEIAKQSHSLAGRKCNHHTTIARFATTFFCVFGHILRKTPLGTASGQVQQGSRCPHYTRIIRPRVKIFFDFVSFFSKIPEKWRNFHHGVLEQERIEYSQEQENDNRYPPGCLARDDGFRDSKERTGCHCRRRSGLPGNTVIRSNAKKKKTPAIGR